MFRQELKDRRGNDLIELGLQVERLDSSGVEFARGIRQESSHVTLVDAYALSLAKVNERVLLTGDRALSKLADECNVPCHGVLWLIDIIFESGQLDPISVFDGLEAIARHPRCRLPTAEIRARRERYSIQGRS